MDSKKLGRELSRPRTLRILYKDAVKLRGLNPKAYKFFLLNRCLKYISIKREELYMEEEIVILEGGSNV